MDDYKAMVLGTEKPKTKAERIEKAAAEKPAKPRETVSVTKRIAALEEKMAKFQDLIDRIDKALADRDAFIAQPQKAAQLGKQRAELANALSLAEEDWAYAVGGERRGAMSRRLP